MPSTNVITVPQLARLVGLPATPVIIDVRTDDDFEADPRILPASFRRDFAAVSTWAPEFNGRHVAVVCQKGQKLSQGVAAWLRHEGIGADPWKAASKLGAGPRGCWFGRTGYRLGTPKGAPSG